MSNKIIGRKEEQQALKDIYNSKRAELVAVYGRRRVGKSYLINNYFSGEKYTCFRALGLQQGSLATQLENFTEIISTTFYDGLPTQAAKSWRQAFRLLTTAIEKRSRSHKIILFFDELPWMATPKSGLLAALDYYWNKHWCQFNHLKLIICGSSASWILKKIIYNKGGLHNRVTRQIVVKPFVLAEVKAYLNYLGCRYNNKQTLELYMTLGGIPFYLDGIKKRLSVAQNINNLYFRKGELLFDEFGKLFRSLFREANAYIELVRIIASKHYGVSRAEIEKNCKLSKKGGALTNKLQDLEEAGFILSFLPMNHKARGLYYKVIDEFSLFYLTWVEPEKKTLIKMERKSNFWRSTYDTPVWHSWAGYAFESVCYKHLDSIRKALDISEGSRANVWKYNPEKGSHQLGAQIDLLFDRNDGAVTLCEIKYTDGPFRIDKAYAQKLLNKVAVFQKITQIKKQIFIVMISASGIKTSMYSEEILAAVVTLEDLFK